VISTSKNPDDVVITYAARTPLAKATKGGFKDTSLEYMIYAMLKAVRENSKIDPSLVEDICIGNVGCRKTRFMFDVFRLTPAGLGRQGLLQAPRLDVGSWLP
jgi:acetyl-CoA acetyltransferase